jgi:hypothetical protein
MNFDARKLIANKIARMIAMGITAVIVFTLFFGLLVYFTQYLWNWLVPLLFSGPVLSYWQMAGLLVLLKILFWPISGGKRWGHRRPWGPRWDQLSPEERERLKSRMREKWCPPATSVSPAQEESPAQPRSSQ